MYRCMECEAEFDFPLLEDEVESVVDYDEESQTYYRTGQHYTIEECPECYSQDIEEYEEDEE